MEGVGFLLAIFSFILVDLGVCVEGFCRKFKFKIEFLILCLISSILIMFLNCFLLYFRVISL